MDIPEVVFRGDDGLRRCSWCAPSDEYRRYHDQEWGLPVGDDQRLFEKLSLEGFQAGLSWRTILSKRDRFRVVFDAFDFHRVARFTDADVERLLLDAGIVRHRGKIEAVINNAARALELVQETGSLAAFFWSFEPESRRDEPLDFEPEVLAYSDASTALSKALKKRGWKFVGPTTIYSLMQAMGLVNDHARLCTQRAAVHQARLAFVRPT